MRKEKADNISGSEQVRNLVCTELLEVSTVPFRRKRAGLPDLRSSVTALVSKAIAEMSDVPRDEAYVRETIGSNPAYIPSDPMENLTQFNRFFDFLLIHLT